jgi:hypothetical protein
MDSDGHFKPKGHPSEYSKLGEDERQGCYEENL